MTIYINSAFEKIHHRGGLCSLVIADDKYEAATMLCRHLDEMSIPHFNDIMPDDMIPIDEKIKGVVILNDGDY